MVGWMMYPTDYNDVLLTARNDVAGRVVWVTGTLDYNGGNSSNWDVNRDLARSPLMPYIGTNYAIWKCPADRSTVTVAGQQRPRVRSNSMSQVFDFGGWLPASQWRIYERKSDIVRPVDTWVFVDEHPGSINDAACAVRIAPPGSASAMIVDFPASYHDGACGFSFADGHSEIHKWQGTTIRPPVTDSLLPLGVPADDSVQDMIWWSSVTTVAK